MPKYIKLLGLKKHIEGGYFKSFYNSRDKVIPITENEKYDPENERSASSSIYFLLEKDDFSAWHKLKSDEIWHYYDGGSPIDIHIISSSKELITKTLGNPFITPGASFQVVINENSWFAADVRNKESFGLVGCTVAPGFEYHDFVLADFDSLSKKYPSHISIIKKFIRENGISHDGHDYNEIFNEKKRASTSEQYINLLKLEKHIEGGYFGIFYTSLSKVAPLHPRYKNDKAITDINRASNSSIYFLLDKSDFSAWHRLKSDELWHYYDGGSPIDIHIITPFGELLTQTLGNPTLTENASFQVAIQAESWFAAEVRDKNSFGLVGCTVSPGFEYHDFELAERNSMIEKYPSFKETIVKFTHG